MTETIDAYFEIRCAVCAARCESLDTDPTGYCEACERDISARIDRTYENLYPLVLQEGDTSTIARKLWQQGCVVMPSKSPRAPRCQCGLWLELDHVARALEHVGAEINASRTADIARARVGARLAPSADLDRWVKLCARVFRHAADASLHLRSCPACIEKAKQNAPRIVRG
jgi:hypothetical protein